MQTVCDLIQQRLHDSGCVVMLSQVRGVGWRRGMGKAAAGSGRGSGGWSHPAPPAAAPHAATPPAPVPATVTVGVACCFIRLRGERGRALPAFRRLTWL
jgi:hypothetical protein